MSVKLDPAIELSELSMLKDVKHRVGCGMVRYLSIVLRRTLQKGIHGAKPYKREFLLE